MWWRKRENWLFGFGIISAVGGLVKIFEWFGFAPFKGSSLGAAAIPSGNHSAAPLITGGLFFLVSVALSLYGLYIANRKARNAPQEGRPLRIIKAEWGVGGTVYKDVTELVRAHAKPDSIRMPVMIGLLTDPFPNTHKHLNVTYSFAREWEVRANEGEEPEKYGEEQSVREIQAMKAKLNSMVDPENAFIVKLSETEYSLYRQLESSFNALQWSQKVALKRICQMTSHPVEQFKEALDGHGFVNSQGIIDTLKRRGFVEVRNGPLMPDISAAKYIDAILQKHPIT